MNPPEHAGRNISREQWMAVQDLLKELEGSAIKPIRRSIFYTSGLLLVAAALVLLSILYLSLIGLVGYGLFAYYQSFIPAYYSTFTHQVSVQTSILTVTIFLIAPAVCGISTLAFMIKPLVAKRSAAITGIEIKAEDEPLLFEFVGRLCDVVGARRPRRIMALGEPNAFAQRQGGLFGFIGGRLTLGLGLPLVAAMRADQLAGILCHEFGHFGQGLAMSLSTLIQRINAWFAHAVYSRDSWDWYLIRNSGTAGSGVGFAFLLARFFVWLTRRILWVLMMFGHAISCFMARQMEYDADRYEGTVVGAKTFVQSSYLITILVAAMRKTSADLSRAWEEKRLGDNLPALIVANGRMFDEETRRRIIDQEMKDKTRLFYTHPAMRKRIARVQAADFPGLLHATTPATVLFYDFEETCRFFTKWQYARELGRKFNESQLIPTAAVIGNTKERQTDFQATQRFFLGTISLSAPLRFEGMVFAAPENVKLACAALAAARQECAELAPQVTRALEALEDSARMRSRVFFARQYRRHGVRFIPKSLQMKRGDDGELEELRVRAQQGRIKAGGELEPIKAAISRRLVAGLRLLYVSSIRARIEDGDELLANLAPLVRAVESCDRVADPIIDLRDRHNVMRSLMASLKGNENDAPLLRVMVRLARDLQREIASIHMALRDVDYPFEHAERTSLGGYLTDMPTARNEIQDAHDKSDGLIERMLKFQARAAGRLALTCERVEEALGLGGEPAGQQPRVAESSGRA